jgi:hypothetical protein
VGEPADAVVHVAVQLVQRHPAVTVAVGGAGAETLDEDVGEGGGSRPVVGEPSAFEGVLGSPRRGQDSASLALERLAEPHRVFGFRQHSRPDRTREATVQQQHDPLARAAAEMAVDELGRHCGRVEAVQVCVRHREIQVAGLVADAVTGDVDNHQVVPRPCGEKPLHPATDEIRGTVDQRLHPEVADPGSVSTSCSAATSCAGDRISLSRESSYVIDAMSSATRLVVRIPATATLPCRCAGSETRR